MTDQRPTFADIQAAATRIEGAVVQTPMLMSRTLSEIVGAEVWLKFENLQFTAAYKERGALNKLLAADATRNAARRDCGIGRQPCPGGRLSRHAARHSGDHRHAGADPDHQGHPDRGPRRQRRPSRRGLRRRPCPCPRARASAKAMSSSIRSTTRRSSPAPGRSRIEMLEAAPDLDMLVVPIGGGGLISGVATAAKAIKPASGSSGSRPRCTRR